jgi:hypothetical protein
MAALGTNTLPGLESLLGSLSLKQPAPTISGAHLLDNPLDIYRAYLADSLVRLTQCEPSVAFDAITTSNDANNGDVAVILPRLGQSAKPKELGFDIIKKVGEAVLLVGLCDRLAAQDVTQSTRNRLLPLLPRASVC